MQVLVKFAYEFNCRQKEVNHFDKPNQDWWDESGSFSALHKLTPCREYIFQVIKRNIINKQINSSTQICNNLNILDVGCVVDYYVNHYQIRGKCNWNRCIRTCNFYSQRTRIKNGA